MSDNQLTPEQIRAQLDEIAARRAKRQREASDDTAAELRELARAQAIDAAEDKHGPVGKSIAALETPGGDLIIVKKPANATYRKFQDSKDAAETACKAFVRPCVVHPLEDNGKPGAAYDKLLDEYPGVLMRLVKACSKLAGWTDEEK